jgi:hypothetical protein
LAAVELVVWQQQLQAQTASMEATLYFQQLPQLAAAAVQKTALQ